MSSRLHRPIKLYDVPDILTFVWRRWTIDKTLACHSLECQLERYR